MMTAEPTEKERAAPARSYGPFVKRLLTVAGLVTGLTLICIPLPIALGVLAGQFNFVTNIGALVSAIPVLVKMSYAHDLLGDPTMGKTGREKHS